jgi:hypothetical protein
MTDFVLHLEGRNLFPLFYKQRPTRLASRFLAARKNKLYITCYGLEEARSTQSRDVQAGYGSPRGLSAFFFMHDTNRFSIEEDCCVVSQYFVTIIFHFSL